MRISLIWAMTRNRVIGRNGTLPWQLPDEMRHFRETTLGHPIVMGRKTFESVGKPLPRRTNIVVSSSTIAVDGVHHASSVSAALELARAHCAREGIDECFVTGGARLYAETLPLADRLYWTTIDAELEGDTFFPEFDESKWTVVDERHHGVDERHAYSYTIRVLDRTNSNATQSSVTE